MGPYLRYGQTYPASPSLTIAASDANSQPTAAAALLVVGSTITDDH